MELEGFSQLERIAEGGMAVLYKGTQTSLSRPVAIKVMKGTLANTPEAHEMFEWESRIVARLDHPHIIRVIDKGLTAEGMPFFVMDYVEGITLKDALRHNKLSDRRKLRVMIQVAKALGYAHRNNIIHRDIKPGNILLDREGNARVVDFGIARLTEDTEISKVNETGMTVGTPAYMAPEQQKGAAFTTSACDIYSLGVIMYLMLAGKLYKPGYPPPSGHNPKVPASLDKITMACLAEDPQKRPSADKLVALLLTALKGAHLKQEQQEEAKQTFKDAKDKFRLLDVIRETDFGSVCLYENREDRSLMVLKKRINNFQGYNEAELLSRLKHRNIINIRGVSRNDRLFITVMEYLSVAACESHGPAHERGRIVCIAEQICDAMIFAHNNRIIHGNLRLAQHPVRRQQHRQSDGFRFRTPLRENAGKQLVCRRRQSAYRPRRCVRRRRDFLSTADRIVTGMEAGMLQPNEAFADIPQHLRTLIKGMLCRDIKVRLSNFEDVKKGLSLLQDNSDEKPARTSNLLPNRTNLPGGGAPLMGNRSHSAGGDQRWPVLVAVRTKTTTA
ncbi:MAG: protein kinase [Gammaproteobacteria bacterium]